jgi:hypothetical protein
VIGVVILLAIVIVALVGWMQLGRYGESDLPAASWQRTDEVFRDPSSGRIMRVWHDPADGTRHYVPEPGSGPPGT